MYFDSALARAYVETMELAFLFERIQKGFPELGKGKSFGALIFLISR